MIFIKKKYLFGILFIFLLGSLLHFTYDWSNQNRLVGLFSAQNESVFEHTKLLILPTFLWYIISYIFTKDSIDKNKYFTSMIISLVVSIILIPLLFYFVKEGLSINSGIVNIAIFFLSGLFGQLLAYHHYKYENKSFSKLIIISISILLIITYIYFSNFPLNLPIFIVP